MTTAQQDTALAAQRDLSSVEKQQAAEKFARAYIAEKGKWGAGAAVARKFDMSPRWGQDIVAAVADSAPALPIGSGRGADRQGQGRTVADAVAARSGGAEAARGVFGSAEPAPAPARSSAPPPTPPTPTATAIGTAVGSRPTAESAAGSADRRQRSGTADRQSRDTSPAAPAAPAAMSAAAGRAFALFGFVFGTLASITANVLYAWIPPAPPAGVDPVKWATDWSPSLPAQATGALFPLTLMVVVEVISRIPWPDGRGWLVARYGGGMVVALGAAVISYGHLHGLLVAYNYDWIGAAVGPLVIDGLMVVCGFGLLAVGRHHKDGAP